TKPKPEPASTNNSKSAEATDAPGKIPGIVDLKPRSKSEIAIEKALTQPIKSVGLEFIDTPLSKVIEFLKSEYDIQIQFGPSSWEFGDEPVTVKLRNVRLESALDLILSEEGLTYAVE